MRWKLRTFLIVTPILAMMLALVIQHFQKLPVDGTAQVLGPVTSGDDMFLDPPSREEVFRAIERVYQSSQGRFAGIFVDTDQAIKIDFVESRLDRERVYPLIGPAMLHHQFWRCEFVVTQEDGMEQNRSIIVDHNHFHMGGPHSSL